MVTSLLQLSCWRFALNSRWPSRKELLRAVEITNKSQNRVLHPLVSERRRPLNKICTFTVNQPKANGCRTGIITFQIRFAGERES